MKSKEAKDQREQLKFAISKAQIESQIDQKSVKGLRLSTKNRKEMRKKFFSPNQLLFKWIL